MSDTLQLNMFGPPEKLSDLPESERWRDDAPVPTDRELLWPWDLTQLLGEDLLHRLYGDIPRRTLLTKDEVCRRCRIQKSQYYDFIREGSLDATNMSSQGAIQDYYRVYRYSVVKFRFNREFVFEQTRCNLPPEDLDRCMKAAEILRKRKQKQEESCRRN